MTSTTTTTTTDATTTTAHTRADTTVPTTGPPGAPTSLTRLFDSAHALLEQDSLPARAVRSLPRLHGGGTVTLATTTDVRPSARRPALVSVIVPCYNYGAFLPGCLDSILGQTGVDVEVLVVDDASTDDTAEVARRYADSDPRVALIRHTVNTGHVVAFNDGYAAAVGEFIVRVDADDLLTEGSLARSVAVFDRYPTVGLVYGHPRHFVTDPPSSVRTQARTWTVWSGRDWIAERCLRGHNCITTPEAVIRAEVMRTVGALDTRLGFAQDMEMWLRIAAVSDVGHIEGADQALHRDHPASMSATTGSSPLLDLEERRTVFECLFDGPGGDLVGADRLHSAARHSLAREALAGASHELVRRDPDMDVVDAYVAFALAVYPPAEMLPDWRALQRRRRCPAAVAPYVPWFVAARVGRRLRTEVGRVRWATTGI